MSEHITAERITDGIKEWLREEIEQSNEGRNRVLDDFAKARRNYAMAIENPSNSDIRKAEGHFSRFRIRLEHADEDTMRDDYSMGRMVHHALMFVSGGFRTQSFLQASNQAEYEQFRFRGKHPTGIALGGVVAAALVDVEPIVRRKDIPQLVANSHVMNGAILQSHYGVNKWFAANPDQVTEALGSSDVPIKAMLDTQKFGTELAVSFIALAAELRGGDLSDVPLLESKSISDVSPEPIYPFAA